MAFRFFKAGASFPSRSEGSDQMKFFFGLLIGLFFAIGIAVGGAYMAFGNLTEIGERDKSQDISKTYELVGFDRIEIGGVYELDVNVGPEFSVVLSGAPDEMDIVEVSVEDGELVLDREERSHHHGRRWNQHGVTATITLPSLSGLEISGIIDGDVSGIDAEQFKADFSGVGAVELSGACGHLRADISGIGAFDASDLKCKTADVSVSGIGDASVYASDEIDISVSGIGSVDVYGSPSRVDKSGGPISDIDVK